MQLILLGPSDCDPQGTFCSGILSVYETGLSCWSSRQIAVGAWFIEAYMRCKDIRKGEDFET